MIQGKKWITMMVLSLLALVSGQWLYSHCQVPCGIYDDPMRIKMMEEHITTIEKAMKEIASLSKENPVNYNQVARWVMNKDLHADELSDIVTYYFMAQRVKPVPKTETKDYEAYRDKLELLHQLLTTAMKAKQTIDLSNIDALRDLLKKFETAYFGPGPK